MFIGKKKSMNRRVGRPRKYLTDNEVATSTSKRAKKIRKMLAVKPPVCICGNRVYMYHLYNDKRQRNQLRAKCMECKYIRVYNPETQQWGPYTLYREKERNYTI